MAGRGDNNHAPELEELISVIIREDARRQQRRNALLAILDEDGDSDSDRSDGKAKKRRHVERNCEDGHAALVADYLCESPMNPSTMFERRFAVSLEIFKMLCLSAKASDPFFVQRTDALGRVGSWTPSWTGVEVNPSTGYGHVLGLGGTTQPT